MCEGRVPGGLFVAAMSWMDARRSGCILPRVARAMVRTREAQRLVSRLRAVLERERELIGWARLHFVVVSVGAWSSRKGLGAHPGRTAMAENGFVPLTVPWRARAGMMPST